MGVKIQWLVENRIILSVMWAEFSGEELRQGAETALQLVLAGEAPVHDVIDMRKMTKYPVNVKEIIAATPIFREQKLGWVVLITNDVMVRFLTQVVMQFSQTRLRIFDEPEAALRFLNDIDRTLPPLPPYHTFGME